MKSTLVLWSIAYFLHLSGLHAIERISCGPGFNKTTPVKGRIDTSTRLAALRTELWKDRLLEGYIITNFNEHQSQELEPGDRRLQFISGFAGKKGVAVVTKSKAAIWVDPNELVQANEMLSCDWILYSSINSEVEMEDWIVKNIRQHQKIGVDDKLIPYNYISDDLRKKVKIINKPNLIDMIWKNKPTPPKIEVKSIDISYTGKSWMKKVAKLRDIFEDGKCDVLIFTALDEIAWLLNVRAMHVNYLPMVKSYLILTKNKICLFMDADKVHKSMNISLQMFSCYNKDCVTLYNYDAIISHLNTYSQIWKAVCIPQDGPFPVINRAIYNSIEPKIHYINESLVLKLKSIKNTVEKVGMRDAHLRDASVFCDIMGYLEDRVKREKWNEAQVASYVDGMRKEQQFSTGISYETQVAFGPHSAYNYYINNETTIQLDNSSVFIIDAGGQYLDGTTSAARTFHFGTPTDEQIDIYTRMLKGLINYSALVFPPDLKAQSTDMLMRAPLWEVGYDYQHPTAHGIGSQLAAEEGPILVDREYRTDEFYEGNFIVAGSSFSKENSYGIKLKNVLEVIKDESFIKLNGQIMGNNLAFQPTTLIPFEPKLINMKLLSPQEIMWINMYNTRIRNEVGDQLKRERRTRGFKWMMEKAQNIPDKFLDHTSNSIPLSYFHNSLFTVAITLLIIQLY
ncbi:xaa-Pro aminopeptidase 1-like [Cimex lectularius]|uniref:Xaa-Pro aminopeptidase n=1 Tax=Cimex lectularius TaxID=79782 RepID=A0A8I6REL1_CIMLE|nr:xaa-Pro aminopeptidase 1-like [Cimex lectularius]